MSGILVSFRKAIQDPRTRHGSFGKNGTPDPPILSNWEITGAQISSLSEIEFFGQESTAYTKGYVCK